MTCFEVRNEFPLSQRVLEIITWEKVRFKAQTSYFRKIEILGSSEYSTVVEYSTRWPILLFQEFLWRFLHLERFLILSDMYGDWELSDIFPASLRHTWYILYTTSKALSIPWKHSHTIWSSKHATFTAFTINTATNTYSVYMPCTKWHVLKSEMNSHISASSKDIHMGESE